MSLPVQDDGHTMTLTFDEEGVHFKVQCPGRAACAMGEWPPLDGIRLGECYVQFTLNELGIDAIDGGNWLVNNIPIKWRIEGNGEDAELWVMLPR